MDDRDIFSSRPSCLARMMDLDAGDQDLWRPEELDAMLEHQLAAPLEFDLSYVGEQASHRLDALRSAEGSPIESFYDLLHHPCPPVELLELTKEFAKACRVRSDRLLPGEIGTLLYILSIVVARTKCRQRITKLDDAALRHSLNWALEQSWVDASTQELLREGDQVIGGAEAKPDA